MTWNLLLQIALVCGSILLLWKGSDWLVDSAAKVGRRLGMSEVIVGLTIVAFGTSAPEFAVTFSAALQGKTDISVGNVVGSNIFNLGIILGLCSMLIPLRTNREVVYRDGMILIGTTGLLYWFLSDYRLQRWEGAVLFGGLLCYLLLLLVWRKKWGDYTPDDALDPQKSFIATIPARATAGDIMKLVAGTVAVVVGGHLLVTSAVVVARFLGVSEWAIAVTIVAAGTSAPELATSVTAALKGFHGMSVGNLVGSDLFNLLGVLGAAGIMRELPVSTGALSSVGMLALMCCIVVLFMRTGWRLYRWEGAILILLGVSRWVLDFMGR
ncbi:MAG: calcium/sodium antiporter [bacterium]